MNIQTFLEQRKVKKLFPRWKREFWYCGALTDYQYELMKQKKPWKATEIELPCETFLINPYSNAGGKIPEVGDILPCIQLDGWVAFYEVTKKYKYEAAAGPWADLAGWDDGYNIDLNLHHCERAK